VVADKVTSRKEVDAIGVDLGNEIWYEESTVKSKARVAAQGFWQVFSVIIDEMYEAVTTKDTLSMCVELWFEGARSDVDYYFTSSVESTFAYKLLLSNFTKNAK